MKLLFWVIALFALAAGLVVAARYNTGYVQFVLPPYRVEISMNLLVVIAVMAFSGGWFVLSLIKQALAMPARVREFRAQRAREKSDATLIDALQGFLAGRYGTAEKRALEARELGAHRAVATLIAARAAHELRAYDRRDEILKGWQSGAGYDELARVISTAGMMLDERRVEDALALIDTLGEKNSAALRLELRAYQQGRRWDDVVATIEQLERRRVYDATQSRELKRGARAEQIKRKALEAGALDEFWRRLPDDERKDPRIALIAAQCFMSLGGAAQARKIVEDALGMEWDAELVHLYGDIGGTDPLPQIENAEKWLRQHPGDGALLLALGKLCVAARLWGKAQSYLEASIAVEPSWSAHLAAGELQENLGNADAARRHFRESLELALVQLRAIGGGRRRTSV